MPSIFGKCINYVNQKIRGWDRYGKSMTFTYKGEEEFTTFIGGFISLGSLILLALYAYLMLSTMFKRDDTSRSVSTTVENLYTDQNPIALKDSTFSFAFRLGGIELETLQDTSIFKTFKLYSADPVKDESGKYSSVQNFEIEIAPCGTEYFKYDDEVHAEEIGVSDYYCPTTRDFYVMGDSFSDTYSYIQLEVELCLDTDGSCADEETVVEAITGALFDMIIVNSYFDFKDYDNPIKTYIDDRFLFDMIYGFNKEYNIFIKNNEAEYDDDYFNIIGEAKQKNFVSVDRVDQRLSGSSSGLTVKFVKDPSYQSYERTVFGILDALGNIGGINEILEVGGGLIVAIFAARLFNYSVISSLYQVDRTNSKDDKDAVIKECENLEQHQDDRHPPEEEKMNDNRRSGGPDTPNSAAGLAGRLTQQREGNALNWKNLTLQLLYQKFIRREGTTSAQAIERTKIYGQAERSLRLRRKYNYTCCDFVYNLCCCCKSKCCSSKSPDSLYNRYKLYEEGTDKYINEFDAVYYARSLRNLQMMIGSLMDDSERTLATYQHINTINHEEKSSEGEEDEYDKIPILYTSGTKKKTEAHNQRISEFLRSYTGEAWTGKDYKLLHGVYTDTKLKNDQMKSMGVDNDEDEDIRSPSRYRGGDSNSEELTMKKTRDPPSDEIPEAEREAISQRLIKVSMPGINSSQSESYEESDE